MIKTVGIGITDGINRKNDIIPTSVLVRAYIDSANRLLPTYYEHDHNKLLGWSQNQGIFCEPGKTSLLISSNVAENDEEFTIAKEIAQSQLAETVLSDHDEEYRILADKLGENLSGKELRCWAGATSFYDDGIVLRTIPKLNELINKGLLPLESLTCIGPGVYSYDGYLLFAHPYFRRGFSRLNSFNEEFLKLFQSLTDKDQTTQVALDMNLIGLLGSEQQILEYDYWWGPKFNDKLENIDFGVTRYKNTMETDFGLDSTEFGWYKQDGRRTFECEEVLEIPNIDNEKYGCRFIHSMVNSETNLPYHLDGAIRAYTEEKMINRLDTSIDKAGRDTEYTKIWRIDGVIPVDIWKQLIHCFYKGNSLIQEYFDGINEEIDSSNKHEKSKKEELLENTMICNMVPDDGIRFAFKLLPKTDEGSIEDSLVYFSEESRDYYEVESIDLGKVLRKNGLECQYIEDTVVDFMDLLTNFPIITCFNLNDANICLRSVKEIVESWKKRKDNRLVTFTIRISYPESLASFSFAGHIDAIASFLSENLNLPESIDAIPMWVEELRKKQEQKYLAKYTINPWSIFETNGQFRFERDYADSELVERDESKDVYSYKFTNDSMNTFLENNKITIKPAVVLNKTICDQCGSDYKYCDCANVLDANVHQIVEKISEVYPFFTIKPAQND